MLYTVHNKPLSYCSITQTLTRVLKSCSVIVVLFDKSSKPELSANERATSSKSFKRLTAVVVLAYRTKKKIASIHQKTYYRTSSIALTL